MVYNCYGIEFMFNEKFKCLSYWVYSVFFVINGLTLSLLILRICWKSMVFHHYRSTRFSMHQLMVSWISLRSRYSTHGDENLFYDEFVFLDKVVSVDMIALWFSIKTWIVFVEKLYFFLWLWRYDLHMKITMNVQFLMKRWKVSSKKVGVVL